MQNPFKDSASGDFNVVHAPWAFWDVAQKKMTKQPPPFRVKLSAFKSNVPVDAKAFVYVPPAGVRVGTP